LEGAFHIYGEIGHLPDDTILTTLDVKSLYTNIPNEEAKEAALNLLDSHRTPTEVPTNTTLIKLLDLVLRCNNFQFNGTNYLQVGGTAMGTRVAPSLANAFMDSFEHKFVYSYPTQPHTWIRYIDDIFCIWTRGEDTLDSFINHLNGCHESIKFTEEKSTAQVHFLDTTVIFKDNGITTDLYTKPTDTHNYLRYDSAHNPSVTKGLPYGQFLRLRRICQTNDMYNKHANEMIVDFTKQGYPINLLQRAKEKAMDKDRDALLTQEQAKKDYEDKLFLITTYQPGFGELKSIVQSNWDLLKKSVATKNLSNKQLIVGYRRPKNLRDL
jgi:hypothetical protein